MLGQKLSKIRVKRIVVIFVVVVLCLFAIVIILSLVSVSPKTARNESLDYSVQRGDLEVQREGGTSVNQTLSQTQTLQRSSEYNQKTRQTDLSEMLQIPKYDIYMVGGANLEMTGPKDISGLTCKNAKDGSYVSKLSVKSGLYVDALNIECSNDASTYEFQGGLGGGLIEIKSPTSGIQKLKGKTGSYLDSIEAYDETGKLLGKAGGSGGNKEYTIDCGEGGKIVGFLGGYDNYINSLNAICSRLHTYY